MKKINRFNFFKNTYCEFKEVSDDIFINNIAHYKSKSDSLYHYTEDGVYRYSDHWGRVANCRWKLVSNLEFKNQINHLGFAEWTDFFDINDTDKLFYIQVDFNLKRVNFKHKQLDSSKSKFLFSAQEAQKRQKQIRILLNEDRWAKHFSQDIKVLRFEIVNELMSTNKSLINIKKIYK